MKKTLALLLTLAMTVAVFASCGTKKANEENNQVENVVDTSAYTLDAVVEKIYEHKTPEFMFGTMPVDLEDEYAPKTYLGLDDLSNIKEAVVSEAMIGSIAYSLVLARVNDAAKAQETAEAMKAGIDTRKWICVEADDVKTAVVGDIVLYVMISSELADSYTAQDVVDGFNAAFAQ